MKFLLRIKSIIIFSILLTLFPLNSIAGSNDAAFEKLKLIIKDYLKKRDDKSKFTKDIENFGIVNDGYKIFIEELSDSLHANFYMILATLDNEKGDWFEKEPIDFLKMGKPLAETDFDKRRCYSNLILVYSKKLPTINKADGYLIKKELDKIVNEIDTLTFKTEIGIDLKRTTRHNVSIIERLLGNYKKAEELIKPLTVKESNFLDGPPEKRTEKMTNAINELGRIYLSEGIAYNKDDLIEKAITKFDEAINILEAENCSPTHLKELYQRKQKALLLLGIDEEFTNLSIKINSFELNDCWKSETKDWRFFFNSIVSDEPNYEIVENTLLSIKQREILKEQNKLKNYLIFFILLASGLLFIGACLLIYSMFNLKNKKNELSEKNTQLQRSIAKLKILQFNSSAVLDTMKGFDAKEGKLGFLNDYLIEIYNQFKDQMKEESGFSAVFFNRKKKEITAKIIGINKNGELLKQAAENYTIDKKSIYYPFYTGKKGLYTENNFQNNYTQHNKNTTDEYLSQKNIASQSIICAPLIFNKNEQPLGIISLQNNTKAFFNKDHIDLMKVIANMLTPVAAYFEIEEQRNLVEQQRNTIKEQRDLIIGIVDHRFRNYYKINNSAIQRIEANIENWDKEKLKNKLIAFGGDYQIHEKLFNSFISWMRIIGLGEHNKPFANGVHTDFNLLQVIESVFEQLYFPIRENSIKYSIVCESQIFIQKMPLIFIQEIVANLVINTIQHFKEIEKEDFQPEIKVEVNLNNEDLLITIADNGEGIPESNAAAMFKKVLTADYNKTQKNGFGNRVIKYILDKINGQATIVYTNKNKGTKIEISIPNQYIKIS